MGEIFERTNCKMGGEMGHPGAFLGFGWAESTGYA
jgi:hypothetical protein